MLIRILCILGVSSKRCLPAARKGKGNEGSRRVVRRAIFLPTCDKVGAWRWLLCKWSSTLAISGAAAVMKPNLMPLLITFENESNLITRPSVSSDRKDLGSS